MILSLELIFGVTFILEELIWNLTDVYFQWSWYFSHSLIHYRFLEVYALDSDSIQLAPAGEEFGPLHTLYSTFSMV